MNTLDPHVLLITRAAQPSRAAMLLTQAGYLVTKTSAEYALASAQSSDPDAIVIDLAAFDELGVMRALDPLTLRAPLLIVTTMPGRYPKKHAQRYALQRAATEDDLISAVDRMLVDAHSRNVAA